MAKLPESGAVVFLNGKDGVFWLRRLRDGSVIPADPSGGQVNEAPSAVPDIAEEEQPRSSFRRGLRR
jgi:hypothetical protein